MGRFRASSLGSGAVMLAVLLLILHRNGTGLLFLAIGGGLLWYGRTQRQAQEKAAQEKAAGERESAEPSAANGAEGASSGGAADEGAGADARRQGDGEA